MIRVMTVASEERIVVGVRTSGVVFAKRFISDFMRTLTNTSQTSFTKKWRTTGTNVAWLFGFRSARCRRVHTRTNSIFVYNTVAFMPRASIAHPASVANTYRFSGDAASVVAFIDDGASTVAVTVVDV